MMVTEKRCKTCKELRPIQDFFKHRPAKDGYQYSCKACAKIYKRRYLKGTPSGTQARPLEVRFWERVEKTDACWLWTGYIGPSGYGTISKGGNCSPPIRAHRLSYELHYGEIPEGLYVCHRCDVRHCVRPDHLFLGTHRANMRDMTQKGRAANARNMHNSTYERAKLTPEHIREIRRLFSAGQRQEAIGDKYAISQNYVSQIVNFRRWKHI